MRRWKIIRWNGIQQEAFIVESADAFGALSQNPAGSYDHMVLSVTEIPFNQFADMSAT